MVGLQFTVDRGRGSDFALAFQGRLDEEIEGEVHRIAIAYTQAMGDVVDKGKAALRADIEAGGFHSGQALAKTWRGAVYPGSGRASLGPAGWFSSTAKAIIEVFDTGAVIRVRNAKYLAIPQGPAKAIIRQMNQASARRRNAYGKFEDEPNPVARVEAALGVHLIAVINKETGHGVLVQAHPPRHGRVRAVAPVAAPLFVLVRQASLKRRIKGRALLKEIETGFPALFASCVAARLGGHE